MNPVQQRFQQWLNASKVTEQEKNLLRQYTPQEINDAFFKNIEFGTAGMRGIMGPGTNRINRFTIQKAALAFANYLKSTFPLTFQNGVVIAHDNRHQAKEFTQICADVLNQSGIPTFTFKELIPTPLLSYSVRELRTAGGIMLTASHNPKQYNGFKVYDRFGCQLTPEEIALLIRELDQLPDYLDIEVPVSDVIAKNIVVSDDIEKSYLDKVLQLQLNPDLKKDDFRVVFSPQHGTSYRLVPYLFKTMKYPFYLVESQATIDPNFSGTQSPNPEEPLAYEVPLALAKKVDAHLVMIADPDADRVGLAFKDKQGNYQLLNGNLSAALLTQYILSQRKKKNTLPVNGVIYDTIVSSPLAKKIAQSYQVKVESFLTGFKYIGDRIQFYKDHAGPQFIFGYEESYGCLIGDFVRDKDGLQALTLYAEMANYYHQFGLTLDQVLEDIFQEFGYHADQQFSIDLIGEDGQKSLNELMTRLRMTPFKPIDGQQVIRFDDYLTQISKTPETMDSIALPKANVIKFYLKDGSTIIVRPSGTEPKCKFYISGVSNSLSSVKQRVIALKDLFFKLYNINEA
jgi:phosphoglucomutase